MSAKLTRRGLLSLIPGGLALLLPRASPGRDRARARAVCALFGDPGSAARVGRAYLDSVPSERDLDRLLALLDPPQAAGLEALRAWAASSVSRDFERGDAVDVGGWQLARTEARLCALCELVTPDTTRV